MNEFTITKGEDRSKRETESVDEEPDDLNDKEIDELMGVLTATTRKPPRKKKVKDDMGPKFLDMYSSIYSMRQEMDRIRKPVGTRDNPVRTCKDLYYGHPQFKDGKLPFINLIKFFF